MNLTPLVEGITVEGVTNSRSIVFDRHYSPTETAQVLDRGMFGDRVVVTEGLRLVG